MASLPLGEKSPVSAPVSVEHQIKTGSLRDLGPARAAAEMDAAAPTLAYEPPSWQSRHVERLSHEYGFWE